MPPRPIPRVTFAWRCPSCRTSSLLQPTIKASTTPSGRSFSSSKPASASSPYSPGYIDVPESKQADAIKRPYMKGILPVPQDVAAKQRYANPEHVKLSTQKPSRTSGPLMREHVELVEWKTQMAEARRGNLKKGMKGLLKRASKVHERQRMQSARRADEKAQRLARLEKQLEQDALTAPTVTAAMRDLPSNILRDDPLHKRRVEAMKENVRAQEEEVQEERADALHTLYMHARSFIVNEQQLAAAIDQQFGSEGQERVFGARGIGIWEDNKMPDTIKRLANQATARHGSGASFGVGSDRNAQLAQRRLREIAESMTGGKM